MYTTVLDTYDYTRCHNFKNFFSNVSEIKLISLSRFKMFSLQMTCSNIFFPCQQKNYTGIWEKIKAKSYQIPLDSYALQHAKSQKIILSGVSSA